MREQQRGFGLPQVKSAASYWTIGDMDDLARLFLSGRRDDLTHSRHDAGAFAAKAAIVYPRLEAKGGTKSIPSPEPFGRKVLSLFRKPVLHWLKERRVRRKVNYYASLPEAILLDIGLARGQIEFVVRQEEMRMAEGRERVKG